MLLVLTRDVFTRTTTLSRLDVVYDGVLAYGPGGWAVGNPRGPLPFGFVCEDEDRGLHVAQPLATIEGAKVPGQTAIPATDGDHDYDVKLTWSNRFNAKLGGDGAPLCADGRMMLVSPVPGFRGIRVHPGATEAHTEGCLLPGTHRDTRKALVTGSTAAYRWLDARARECEARGEALRLRVQRDPAAWSAFQAAGGAAG